MAIVAMQKVAVLAHRSHKEQMLQALQEMGVLEISEAASPGNIDHTEVNFHAAEVQFAFETLSRFASKETIATTSKPTNANDILTAVSTTDVRGIVERLHALEETDTEAERLITELAEKKETLTPWLNLTRFLDADTETDRTIILFGSLPETSYDVCGETLSQELPRTALERVSTLSGITYVIAAVWKTDRARFEEIVTGLGWSMITLPRQPGLAAVAFEEASVEEKRLRRQKEQNREERVRMSVELPNVRKVQSFLSWLDDKQAARESMLETAATVTLLGWMPRESIALIESRLQQISLAIAILKVKADDGEEPPIQLKNLRIFAPFRSVTTLYGLPRSGEMDPTSSLAPFFTLFFALCLTDAGYGAVLALLFGGYLLKTRKSPDASPLIWTLFLGGIATIMAGILFGGWFGLAVNQVPAWLTVEHADGSRRFLGQIWNLTERGGIMFLLYLSLILGITHIFYGMFLAGLHKWLHGRKAQAIWQDFFNHALLGAVILRVIASEPYVHTAQWFLFVVLALFVWGKGYGSPWYLRPLMGAMGLVNFAMNMLTNGLSYLRILALGLVTGSLAGAVNQVALALGALFPLWVGIPVILLIFLVGHLVSIALNTLGTFIHSGRLQFIEFFSQFFEGGGRVYRPLSRRILP